MRALLGTLGFLILLCSLFFVIMGISDLISGEEEAGLMIALSVFFAGTGYGGYWLLRYGFAGTHATAESDDALEQRVLELAQRSQGRLSVSEVALLPGCNVDTARKVLDELCRKGVASHWVSDAGAMVYVFEGLLPGDKATAQDPLG